MQRGAAAAAPKIARPHSCERCSLLPPLSRRRCLLAGALVWAGLPARANQERLRLAIIPHLPAAVLMERYATLGRHLERELGQPVDLVSAPDYRSHALRVAAGDYDLVVTAPQFVHLALTDGGYQPIVSIGRNLTTHIAVRADSPLDGLASLRGQRVATSDMLSLPAINGAALLERAGVPAASYTLHYYPNNSAALHALLIGDADATFLGMTSLTAATPEQRARIRMLATSDPVGPAHVLGKAALGKALLERLRDAMARFEGTDEGRQFFGMRGIEPGEGAMVRPIEVRELRWLDTVTRRLLAAPAPAKP